MNFKVIGIAGLPGSGKSRVMEKLQAQGYSRYNDINREWNTNLPKARTEVQQGKSVAISDIMFCEESWRQRLERELGVSVQWIFLENNPWLCAKNCLFRFLFQKPHRPLQQEIEKIRELTIWYAPPPGADIRPVPQADANLPHTCI